MKMSDIPEMRQRFLKKRWGQIVKAIAPTVMATLLKKKPIRIEIDINTNGVVQWRTVETIEKVSNNEENYVKKITTFYDIIK